MKELIFIMTFHDNGPDMFVGKSEVHGWHRTTVKDKRHIFDHYPKPEDLSEIASAIARFHSVDPAEIELQIQKTFILA